MKITFEDRDWQFDEDELDTKQATVLYYTYKMTIEDWIAGVSHADQRSLHFSYWLMLQQNGVIKPIADCNPKIIAFAVAYGAAREAEAEAAEAAAEAEAPTVVPTIPSPPGEPPSPVPVIPTATTPLPPVPVPVPTAY